MIYSMDFLKKLDKNRHRDIYARITLLTFDEQPVEYIQGKVIGGSINIDGTSALRRTCNLTLVSANLDTNIFLLGLERKFILEIGLQNKVDNNYPDIIWFKEGLFVTTGLSTSRQASNYQISLNGKDKMCLLNGDVGGTMPYSVDFATLEEVSADGNTVTYTKVKIKDIIRNAVEEFGGESPYNIIINDLDESGLELLQYRGNKDIPIYAFRKFSDMNDINFFNITLDGDMEVYIKEILGIPIEKGYEVGKKVTLKSIPSNYIDKFTNDLVNTDKKVYFAFSLDGEKFSIVKAEQGDSVGYRQTDLIYVEDLIANVGDSLTSVLDKIVSMLVNYEYFYDIDGRFVFQKKSSNITWGQQLIDQNETGKKYGSYYNLQTYFGNCKINSNIFYNFEDNDLVISFNNNPELSNVKNDFAIWGTKKGISGEELPVHLRFALDRKPEAYTTYRPKEVRVKPNDEDDNTEIYQELTIEQQKSYPQFTFIAGEPGQWSITKKDTDDIQYIVTCDWREIIYQMALDYYKFRDTKKDFYQQIIQNNIDPDTGLSRYPTGRTYYEQYYTDILGFWRGLFSFRIEKKDKAEYVIKPGFFRQVLLSPKTYKKGKYFTKEDSYKALTFKTIDENKDTIERLVNLDEVNRFPIYSLDNSRSFNEEKIYYELYDEGNDLNYFSKEFNEEPSQLNFWFDFLDTTGDLGKYSVRAIGQRPKNINNSNIKSIYYKRVPDLIFVDSNSKQSSQKISYSVNGEEKIEELNPVELDTKTAYTYITSTTALENCLTTSTQGISAMDELQKCLNDYTFCKENISLTAVPIYYMKPNVRVSIKDEQSKVNGEYLVNKITLPLTYNGTMSLNVIKIVDDIY